MRIFKRRWKSKTAGKIDESGKYSLTWHDAYNRLNHTWPAYRDKATSESFGRYLETLSRQRSVGQVLAGDLSQWVDSLPQVTIAKLVKLHLLDRSRASSCQPLNEHIEHYRQWRLDRHRHQLDTGTILTRIKMTCKVAEFNSWADVQLGGTEALEAAITKIQSKAGISDRTRNRYGQAMHGFAAWMVKCRRANHNPLTGWERSREPETEHRRALNPEEASRLIAAADAGEMMVGRTNKGRWHYRKTGAEMPGGVRWVLTGPTRALLYRVAVETSLRRGALERLTVGDIDLKERCVTAKGVAGTKNPRKIVIPLKNQTVHMLRQHLQDRLPTAPAFDMPSWCETAKMLKADLETARRQWIKEGQTPKEKARRAQCDFLAAIDCEGRRVDFHALRVTCSSWLDQAGVSASIAKRVTGHRSTNTLQKHYQRASQSETRRAVESLPDIDLIPFAATGTDDRTDTAGELTAKLTAFARDDTGQDETECEADRDNKPKTHFQCGWQDSNLRPSVPETGALSN